MLSLLRDHIIAAVTAEYFEGRFGQDRGQIAQVYHLLAASLASSRAFHGVCLYHWAMPCVEALRGISTESG
jgi:hypothetical protein